MLRGVGQGRAVTACAGKRPTAHRKGNRSVRSDKSHIVRHKTGRFECCGGPGTGDPARPRAGRFTSHNVFLSYGRGSTGRAVAPPAAPTAQLEKSGARMEVQPLRGDEYAAGPESIRGRLESRRTSRVFRASLSAFNVAGDSGRRRLLEWTVGNGERAGKTPTRSLQ